MEGNLPQAWGLPGGFITGGGGRAERLSRVAASCTCPLSQGGPLARRAQRDGLRRGSRGPFPPSGLLPTTPRNDHVSRVTDEQQSRELSQEERDRGAVATGCPEPLSLASSAAAMTRSGRRRGALPRRRPQDGHPAPLARRPR